MPIPGINDDWLGTAPDLGALEHGMQAAGSSLATNGVAIDWRVGPFGSYQLEASTNISQQTWTLIGSPVQALAASLRTTAAVTMDSQRFFRLQHAPP